MSDLTHMVRDTEHGWVETMGWIGNSELVEWGRTAYVMGCGGRSDLRTTHNRLAIAPPGKLPTCPECAVFRDLLLEIGRTESR